MQVCVEEKKLWSTWRRLKGAIQMWSIYHFPLSLLYSVQQWFNGPIRQGSVFTADTWYNGQARGGCCGWRAKQNQGCCLSLPFLFVPYLNMTHAWWCSSRLAWSSTFPQLHAVITLTDTENMGIITSSTESWQICPVQYILNSEDGVQ